MARGAEPQKIHGPYQHPSEGPYMTKEYHGHGGNLTLGTKVGGAENVNDRRTVANPPGTNPPVKLRRK
jgi:hypothetical protein